MMLLTYKLCDFRTPDTNRGLLVDRDAFITLLNSPELQKGLRDRKLFGAITHKVRDEFLFRNCKSVGSHQDYLMTSPYLCNVLTDLRIEDDDNGFERVVGDLLVFDNTAGKSLQMMIGIGTNMQVSMSVYSKIINNKWHFIRMNGVDFTTQGALSTELLNVIKDVK